MRFETAASCGLKCAAMAEQILDGGEETLRIMARAWLVESTFGVERRAQGGGRRENTLGAVDR